MSRSNKDSFLKDFESITEDKKERKNKLERYKVIYEIINERYLWELGRKEILEGKANNIIIFVGIILGLQAGLGSFLLKEMNKNYMYPYLSNIFLVGVIFLAISIICGLIAYWINEWNVVPNAEYFISNYSDKNQLEIYGFMIANKVESTEDNNDLNDKKVVFIKCGLGFLVGGIILNIYFIYEIIKFNI